MSVDSKHYLIYGYDLKGKETDSFENWKWSDEGESFLCNQVPGEIQLFDDPMSGCHLYFGYVLASGYAYDGGVTIISEEELINAKKLVQERLKYLEAIEVIRFNSFVQNPELIFFEECC